MRSLVIIIAACLTVCAAAVVRGVERGFEWLLGVMPVTNPTFASAYEPETWGGTRASADPHVARHEAGMSRRAAMRGI